MIGKYARERIRTRAEDNITEYMTGGFQYKDSHLQFFPHAEGYVNASVIELICMTCRPAAISYTTSYDYVFNYTDHLGNIRLSYSVDPVYGDLKVLEENHYYPFGLKHTNYNSDVLLYSKNSIGTKTLKVMPPVVVEPSYNYKYNGKELEDELGKNTYAYGWRDYDPAIGRFNKMDRFSEKYHALTLYGYAGNNPVIFNDIQGDSIGVGKDMFNKFRNDAQGRKNEILNGRQSQIDNLMSKGKYDKVKKLQEKFASEDAKIGSDMSVLDATLHELSVLESSSQVYNLYENCSEVSSGADGDTRYNTSTGEVDIRSRGKFSMGVFAHELKHGYQFEIGNLSFTPSGLGGTLYDMTDEYEAFSRGSFFGAISMDNEIRNIYLGRGLSLTPINMTTPNGITTHGEQMRMQTLSNGIRGTAQQQFYIGSQGLHNLASAINLIQF